MVKKTLLELRLDKDLSRGQVSKDTFIPNMTLYQFEKGNSIPNVIDALILAKYYGKKVKDIDWGLKGGDI